VVTPSDGLVSAFPVLSALWQNERVTTCADLGCNSDRSEVRELEKTVDFRSQQVESYFTTARIGFLPVTESVALSADQGKQDVTSSDANQSCEN
jgi:hypothetical protein